MQEPKINALNGQNQYTERSQVFQDALKRMKYQPEDKPKVSKTEFKAAKDPVEFKVENKELEIFKNHMEEEFSCAEVDDELINKVLIEYMKDKAYYDLLGEVKEQGLRINEFLLYADTVYYA